MCSVASSATACVPPTEANFLFISHSLLLHMMVERRAVENSMSENDSIESQTVQCFISRLVTASS